MTRLSFDHKPTVASEQERIEAAGGLVIRSRVMAVLAVSRALGDLELKKLVRDRMQDLCYLCILK